MGLLAAVAIAPLIYCPQEPAPKPVMPSPLAPEVVLAGDSDPVPLRAFGLGNGGIDESRRPGALRWSNRGCTTPGGIRVHCLAAGIKVTFPSGRELLVAPDGFLHLRDDSKAGPFKAGVELRLGDGSAVRILLSQAQRKRVRDVIVVHGDKALQPWRRGRPANEVSRVAYWGGIRLCCCGDGGEIYRVVAIGPLITLDRVLVPIDRAEEAPDERLVVLTEPLLRALHKLPHQHRAPEPALRSAVAAVAATAARARRIFPTGAALQRAEHDALRWVLRGGYELELALDGPRSPRLSLFAGRSRRPMVEWTLAANSAAFLNNPNAHQPGAPRWHGNGLPMPRVAPELQVRDTLLERVQALRVMRRLKE